MTRILPAARLLPAVIPYLAVLIGLYGLSNIWAAMGLYHAGLLAYLLTRPAGPGWRQLVRGWKAKPALFLLILCALSGLTIYLAFPLARMSLPLGESLTGLGVKEGQWSLLFAYYVIVTPGLEELFWRGHLGSDAKGIAFSDVLFGGYHVLVLLKFLQIPWVLTAFVVLTGMGWLWRQIRRDSGGLLVPVLSHLVADASTMIAVYALTR